MPHARSAGPAIEPAQGLILGLNRLLHPGVERLNGLPRAGVCRPEANHRHVTLM